MNKHVVMTLIIVFMPIIQASEYNDFAIKKCNEIKKEFIQSEIKRKAKIAMEARINKKLQQFEESQRGICTEVYRVCTIPIKRTFPENSQEPLAQLVINAVKDQQQSSLWGWYIRYKWIVHMNNTRSLCCRVDVQPHELLSAYQDNV